MSIFSMKKINKIYILFFCFSFFLLSYYNTNAANSINENNVSGWAWSENVGWTSFNCVTDGKYDCGTRN